MKKTFTSFSRAALLMLAGLCFSSVSAQDNVGKLMSVDPTPGKSFDYINFPGGIQLKFNSRNVEAQKATCQYMPIGSSSYITESVSTELLGNGDFRVTGTNYYNEAAAGSTVTFTITGVTVNGVTATESAYEDNDAVSVDNGTVVVEYPVPAVAFMPEQEEWPSAMYSYFAPGTPEGYATLTFNEDIVSVSEVTLIFGQHSIGDEGGSGDNPDPSFDIPYVINGNKLTVNLTGINFAENANLASYTTKGCTIMIFGVESESGQTYPSGSPCISHIITQFVNSTYDNVPLPEKMNESASENGISEVGGILDTIYLTWGIPVMATMDNLMVQVSINNGAPRFVPAEVTEDGDLAVNVSQYSSRDGSPVEGNYTVTINSGIVMDSEGKVNKKQSISYSFTSSAVKTIGISDEGSFKVYNMNGVKVLDTQSKEALESLPSGLYIINGKKVIKK